MKKKHQQRAQVIVQYLFEKIQKKEIQVFFVCFLVAFVLWLFNYLNKTQTISYNYPIIFEYDKNNYIPLQELPKEFTVNLTGTGWQILKRKMGMGIDPVRYVVRQPVNRPNPYLSGATLRRYLQRVADGLQVGEVITDTIPLLFDKKIKKYFRLSVAPESIQLKKQWQIRGGIRILPEKVMLEGPEKLLLSLPDPWPLRIEQKEISGEFKEMIPLKLEEEKKELVSFEKKEVEVTFNTEEIQKEK